MSLLDQLKNKFRRPDEVEAEAAAQAAAEAASPEAQDREVDALLSEIDQRLAEQQQVAAAGREAEPQSAAEALLPAAETEDNLSRLGEPSSFEDDGAALPLIGRQPVAKQQRLLLGLIGAGAVTFLVTAALALNAAGRQWQVLDLAALAEDPAFLDVAAA